jgi:endonuclease-3 related protein
VRKLKSHKLIDRLSALGPDLMDIYVRLYRQHGPQGWWPGDGPLDVIIGAILTQAARWTNVELAIGNLKQAGYCSIVAIDRSSEEELAIMVRPSGYFNSKARKLKAFARYVCQHFDGDLTAFLAKEPGTLRVELLSIYGIGPETADDILLYAAGRPYFVIDSYTRRILQRVMGMPPAKWTNDYRLYQALFHDNLPKNAIMFNEYHALLDRHAQKVCTKIPDCHGCCLRDVCYIGQRCHKSVGATSLNRYSQNYHL